MKTARRKGHDFERDIARQFREELGFIDCMTKREARGGDWHLTDDGRDLIGTSPFSVQCKRLANYASVNTIEEITPKVIRVRLPDGTDHVAEDVPLLLTKANGKETMAVLPWSELKKFLRAYYA